MNKIDYKYIYNNFAAAYHEMILAEDNDQALKNLILKILNNRNHVLDIGGGTGRISIYLKGIQCKVLSIDNCFPMLREQIVQRGKYKGSQMIVLASMRNLPLINSWADLTIAGWSIGHMTNWYRESWKSIIWKILFNLEKATKPGGDIIIIETLSTGNKKPNPPNRKHASYYEWLEKELKYQKYIIRTDYQFSSVQEAVKKTEFFFGNKLSEKIKNNNWDRIPEWSGVWHRHKPIEE